MTHDFIPSSPYPRQIGLKGATPMPKGFEKHVDITDQIIAACYEVHNILGPGLEERFYRDALIIEIQLRGYIATREQEFLVEYKGRPLGLHRADIIVDDKVLIEVKAVTGVIQRIHVAQTISERKVSKVPVAMVVNFGDTRVQIRRLEERDQ
jgi:GxxExxY protein